MRIRSAATSTPAFGARQTAATRAPLATAMAPALSQAEASQIADVFPERPSVTQKLYGPRSTVHTPEALGSRLDLSA